MNQIEAMKQALEALEDARLHIFLGDKNGVEANIRAHKQCESLRQAIAEAEKQEPVAWVNNERNTITWDKLYPDMTPLYTHPQPKREADIDLYSLLACNVEAGVFENQVAPILLDNGFGPQVIKEKNT